MSYHGGGGAYLVVLSIFYPSSYRKAPILSIGIYYNPTASPSTIVLAISMHPPVSFASQELAQID